MKKIMQLLFCLGMMFCLIVPVAAEEEWDLYSDYYYLIDLDNGQIILDQGSEEMIYPASMTKMMTLIVGLENIENLQDRIVLDEDIFAGLYEENASMAGFYLNESVTLEDCLYGLFLPSGAETTRAIAFYVSGSEEAYVELMNQKAQELNMTGTHFVNTTGLHDNEHYTTLRDMATLLTYCLQNEQFRTIFSTRSYVAKSGSMHTGGIRWQSSTFKSIDQVGWQGLDESAILGGKTGYTIPAGLCLASVGEWDHRRYMLITAHAPTGGAAYHAIDAVTVYRTIFQDYVKSVLLTPEEVLGTAKVRYNLTHPEIEFHASQKVELTLPASMDLSQIEVYLSVMERYEAPIEEGEYLGTATLLYQGEPIYSFELTADSAIGRNPILYGFSIMGKWMMDHLIFTGFLLFVLGFVLWRWHLYRQELRLRQVKRKKRRMRYR